MTSSLNLNGGPGHFVAACAMILALTMGAAQALETWESEPAGGGGSGDLESPQDPYVDEVTLMCGGKSDEFDVPVGPHTGVAASHDQASFDVVALDLYRRVGMGKPNCDSSNCGFGQSCPSLGGSQTTSGGASADWRSSASRYVDLDVKPGTKAIKTCKNCY